MVRTLTVTVPLSHSFRDNKALDLWDGEASSELCYLRLCYIWPFLELLHQSHKHFYLIPGIFTREAASALLLTVRTLASVDHRGHIVSTSSKPIQQLLTALWPECSGASAPWHCGFSPWSGDNGLSTAAWLAVHRLICRSGASAESRPVLVGGWVASFE